VGSQLQQLWELGGGCRNHAETREIDMLRRWIVAAGIAGVFLAVGAQTAAAEWYDKGVALKAGENTEAHMKGTFAFTSSQGGVHCESGTMKLKFTGGTAEGTVPVIGVETPKACELSGGLVFLCGGTTTLKSITPASLPKIVNNGGTSITLSTLVLDYECNNGFKFTVSSIASEPLVGTPDNAKAITKVAFAGMLNSTLGVKVTIVYNMNMVGADSGTYGLA
jgi:hypothetical protein